MPETKLTSFMAIFTIVMVKILHFMVYPRVTRKYF